VVAESSNQGATGQGAPNIMRPALRTPMAHQVNDSHPRIRRGIAGNNLGGVIRAGVADDNQFPTRELIVVGDACTNDTAEVVARYATADPRVRVVNLVRHWSAQSGPHNVGRALASGPLIA